MDYGVRVRVGPAGAGFGVGPTQEGEDVVSLSIPRTLFTLFLIILVTIITSTRHTIAAAKHKACQTQDHVWEGKGVLFCSSATTCLP